MKKYLIFILFISISITSYSQVDYSVFLKKKISKKDMEGFTNLSKFKKHNYSKCLKGNCKNGKSLLKHSFLVRKERNTKIIHTVLVDGMFKNGKLNGDAEIVYYTKFFYNEVKDGVFSSKNAILSQTKYYEYLKANFTDNVTTNGEYTIRLKEKVFDFKKEGYFGVFNKEKTILMNFVEKPNFVKHFSDWDYNKKLLTYTYKGSFESLSILDAKQFEKVELQFTTLYDTKTDDKYTITIKPLKTENTYTFIQKLKTYSKTTCTKAKSFSIINDECDGCWLGDMTLVEHKKFLKKNKQKSIENEEQLEKQRIAKRIAKVKNWTGKYIRDQNNTLYYVDYTDDKGCVYATKIPFEKYESGAKIVLWDNCKIERLKLQEDNYTICQNCFGSGKVSAQVVYKTDHYWTDSNGKKHYEKTTETKTRKSEDVTCPVCKGFGYE